jgi:hypothetical protein
MNSTRTRNRRGRPVSGKKGFMVRMPSDAFEAMKHIAEDNALSVGDWLALLHVPEYRPRGTADNDQMPGLLGDRQRLDLLLSETSRLFEMLFEAVDCDPRTADDDSVARALSTLEAKRKRLMSFLKRECPERYRNY